MGQVLHSSATTTEAVRRAKQDSQESLRLLAGLSDAGIVWKTEVLAAIRDGADVEGVVLPPEDSLREEVPMPSAP